MKLFLHKIYTYFNFFINQNLHKKIYFLIFLLFFSNFLELLSLSLIIPLTHAVVTNNDLLGINNIIINFSPLIFFENFFSMSFDKKYYLISSYILIFLITIFIKNLSLLFIFKYKFNLFSVIEKSLKYNAMKKFLNTNLEIYTKQSQAKLLYNSTRISDVINYFESVYNIFNEIIFFLFIIISLFLYFSFKVVLVFILVCNICFTFCKVL